MNSKPDSPLKRQAPPDFFSPHVARARRFYLDLKPDRKAALAVVSGGCEDCAPDYAIHRADFPYFSIEFVARGKGTARLNGRSHGLQAGTVFCYGPGVRQDIVSEPREPLMKYFVDFSGTKTRTLLASCGLAPGRGLRVFALHEVQGVFEELIRNGLRATRLSGTICAKLLEYLALKIAESAAPMSNGGSQAFLKYQQCCQHVQEHARRLRTLEQIARECHVNAAYLCRLFRRFDHQTPYQCLLRLKMNLPAELLQKPEILVKQVAEQSGIADPFQFSRAFKRTFGLSPNAFRQLR